jgi:hypothetical protein
VSEVIKAKFPDFGLLQRSIVGQFLLVNTIVANNTSFANGNQYPNDCDAFAQNQIVSGAGNLVMAGSQCPGVVTTADPQLGPLQMNGGNTPTMANYQEQPDIQCRRSWEFASY